MVIFASMVLVAGAFWLVYELIQREIDNAQTY